MEYHSLSDEEKKKVRKAIYARACKEIAKDEKFRIVSLGCGIDLKAMADAMHQNADIDANNVLLSNETCLVGINEYLNEDDRRINMHHMGSNGIPVSVSPLGAKIKNLTDAFALVNSKKISVAILGALQVAANGDFANWYISEENKIGPGSSMSLAKNAKMVIICMIEKDAHGNRKLVKKCDKPLTGERCVDLVITDQGVYKPDGDKFKVLEIFDINTYEYSSIKI